jgi:hypothetical protein
MTQPLYVLFIEGEPQAIEGKQALIKAVHEQLFEAAGEECIGPVLEITDDLATVGGSWSNIREQAIKWGHEEQDQRMELTESQHEWRAQATRGDDWRHW